MHLLARFAREVVATIAVLGVTLLVPACGGSSAETTQPMGGTSGGGGTTSGAISIGATPATLTIAAGGLGTSAISIGRSAGFTGAVTLSLDSPPSGIAATSASSPTTGVTATMTINVASSVSAGTYNLSVKGVSSGVTDKTASIALTVASSQPVGFSVSVDPVEFELPPGKGWNTNGLVQIARTNGFAGAATVTISPLSNAKIAFAAPSPGTIAAGETATNVLTLSADGAPPGVYTGTVRVSAPGYGDQSAQLRVRMSAPSTGSITWKYCNASRVPRFFAVRDGSGAWQHIVPGGPRAGTAADPTTFSFNLSSATAAVATVNLGEKTSTSSLIQGFDWKIYYMTSQEIIDQAAQECVRYPDVTTRKASATVSGYTSFDAVMPTASYYALANVGSTGPLSTTLSLSNLQPGPFDLLTTRSSFTAGGLSPIVVQSLVLQRGLDPATNATFAPVNFAADGVAPSIRTVSFTNSNGESFSTLSTLLTAGGLIGQFTATAAYAVTDRP